MLFLVGIQGVKRVSEAVLELRALILSRVVGTRKLPRINPAQPVQIPTLRSKQMNLFIPVGTQTHEQARKASLLWWEEIVRGPTLARV